MSEETLYRAVTKRPNGQVFAFTGLHLEAEDAAMELIRAGSDPERVLIETWRLEAAKAWRPGGKLS